MSTTRPCSASTSSAFCPASRCDCCSVARVAASRSPCRWATRCSRCAGSRRTASTYNRRWIVSDLSYPARMRLRAGATVALVGNPNCGKTALFNLLTGARQKVANYAGVTVERKVGTARLANGRIVQVVDLPGAYSLTPATPDEQITLEVIEGRRHGEP